MMRYALLFLTALTIGACSDQGPSPQDPISGMWYASANDGSGWQITLDVRQNGRVTGSGIVADAPFGDCHFTVVGQFASPALNLTASCDGRSMTLALTVSAQREYMEGRITGAGFNAGGIFQKYP